MRTAHLFAGAGGGILADLILGHDPVVAVEWDAYACAVLRERFPGLRVIEGDVRTVDFARELAGVDALCAGFPCQDISAAGKGAGIDGERSGLYREVIRAIDAVRPAWVFLENSPLIRTRGRHIVIADLVARGYSWRDGQLAASDVGASHIRNRWWCLAKRADADRVRELQPQGLEREQRGWAGDLGINVADSDQIGRLRRPWALGACGWAEPAHGCGDMADASGERLAQRDDQRSHGQQEQPSASGASHLAQPEHRGCEGWDQEARNEQSGSAMPPSWWSAEPGMGRVAHGVAHRAHRIKCLGNGQVPLQAAAAWIALGGPTPELT